MRARERERERRRERESKRERGAALHLGDTADALLPLLGQVQRQDSPGFKRAVN